ncbi:MAG: hypothetical protein BGO55_24810 [Sphingobacteriales bacterium 50-39]|nr:hypothetical protein [Sphingobacteriales bacterium]OJW58508.1 MAG: hypothetical protein BGO55_24810 [Sphingobacteriales bacterium 50-39]
MRVVSFVFAMILGAATYGQKRSEDTVLQKPPQTLGEAVVTGAGSFVASDKAKGASLSPIDAVTVAGNGGDLANALRFLPGAQQIGEKEGLFVRGGTSEETKQFVDGTLLRSPNFASVPNVPQSARLNPFLFKGILFSTGGYSALYGQALSSALILETIDLPEESSVSGHIFPQHMGLGFQQLGKKGNDSYGMNLGYGNLQPYNKIIPQQQDYFHGPEYLTTDANFRIRTGKEGMLKFYTNYGYSHTGVHAPDIDHPGGTSTFEIRDRNEYANLSWRQPLGKDWKIDAAVAGNYQHTSILDSADIRRHFFQGRTVLARSFSHFQALRFGGEYLSDSTDHLTAVFAEGDIYLARNLAIKAGIRAEHASLLRSTHLAPRISLGYRLPEGGQINMAYGIFYQQHSQATHWIVNYQKKGHNRLFRIEAYYKSYDRLPVTDSITTRYDGTGYAKGIELFWHDKKTFKGLDYWVTYTYLDTKRKWLQYPYQLRPPFATPHTASIALKRFFQDLNFSANMSYAFATGRPYYYFGTGADGKTTIGDQGTTKVYSVMNLSFAWLFTMLPKWKRKDFSGIGFGVNNVLGSHPVFGYDYSYDGLRKQPVSLPAIRSYYIGLFMSFGIDRRDDFIDENL